VAAQIAPPLGAPNCAAATTPDFNVRTTTTIGKSKPDFDDSVIELEAIAPREPQRSTDAIRRDLFLERAAKCRMLAATAVTDDGRRVLLQMAEYYDEAAELAPSSQRLRGKHFR
jgi:hypothetical protein